MKRGTGMSQGRDGCDHDGDKEGMTILLPLLLVYQPVHIQFSALTTIARNRRQRHMGSRKDENVHQSQN